MRPKREAPDADTRFVLFFRFPYCLWCGMGLDPLTAAAHHRLERSHGGTWHLSNILLLHHGCHNVEPHSVHQNPRRAYEDGVLIRSGIKGPLDLPVWSHRERSWFKLLDDGQRRLITTLEAEAAFS